MLLSDELSLTHRQQLGYSEKLPLDLLSQLLRVAVPSLQAVLPLYFGLFYGFFFFHTLTVPVSRVRLEQGKSYLVTISAKQAMSTTIFPSNKSCDTGAHLSTGRSWLPTSIDKC